jgi:hypothetical protein
MGGGDTGAAKMWLFTSQGKKMSRIAIEKGFDWKKTVSPILPGCPEWCPATHFGYLESGEMGIQMKDGSTKVSHSHRRSSRAVPRLPATAPACSQYRPPDPRTPPPDAPIPIHRRSRRANPILCRRATCP